MSTARDDIDRIAAGMEILVEFSPDRIEVLRAAPLGRAPQLHLHGPRLTEENVPNLAAGLSEVVLTILESSGASLQPIGFPLTGRRYADFGNPEAGTLRGGPRPIPATERDIRALRIPWPGRTASLFFHRTDVFAGLTGLELRRRELLLVPVGPDQDRRPELLPHHLPMPRTAPLATAPPWKGTPRPLPWLSPESMGLDGRFIDAPPQPGNGDPAKRFDIVITGDGFTEEELPRFDALAGRLRTELAGMQPFRRMSPLINWHVVRVASTSSGINRCPNPEPSVPPRRTFYGVEGCWDNTGVPGFLGIHHPERVQWAAEQVAPWEHVELVIVIANCSEWGGHAWVGWKTAVVTTHSYLFAELASHECAHVISLLAEEYIVCVKDDALWLDPNKARLPEVGRSVRRHIGGAQKDFPSMHDSVWWRELATMPGERNADGTFAAVVTVLDPIVSQDEISPDERPGQAGFIGAFWGCQDAIDLAQLQRFIRMAADVPGIDVRVVEDLLRSVLGVSTRPTLDAAVHCDPFWDPRSAFYFRPSAHCRMRHPRYEFCRVCQHVISNDIRDAAGQPVVPPLP